MIIAEGRVERTAYVLQRGSVEIYHQGPPELRLAVLHPPAMFGEMALVSDKPRSVSARALEAVEVQAFTREEMLAIWQTYPSTAVELIRLLSERIRALDALVETLSDPLILVSLRKQAELLSGMGAYAEAGPFLKCLLAIQEQTLGPDHPDVADSLRAYASLLKKMNRLEEAAQIEARLSPAQ